jgi:hypothetical protein
MSQFKHYLEIIQEQKYNYNEGLFDKLPFFKKKLEKEGVKPDPSIMSKFNFKNIFSKNENKVFKGTNERDLISYSMDKIINNNDIKDIFNGNREPIKKEDVFNQLQIQEETSKINEFTERINKIKDFFKKGETAYEPKDYLSVFEKLGINFSYKSKEYNVFYYESNDPINGLLNSFSILDHYREIRKMDHLIETDNKKDNKQPPSIKISETITLLEKIKNDFFKYVEDVLTKYEKTIEKIKDSIIEFKKQTLDALRQKGTTKNITININSKEILVYDLIKNIYFIQMIKYFKQDGFLVEYKKYEESDSKSRAADKNKNEEKQKLKSDLEKQTIELNKEMIEKIKKLQIPVDTIIKERDEILEKIKSNITVEYLKDENNYKELDIISSKLGNIFYGLYTKEFLVITSNYNRYYLFDLRVTNIKYIPEKNYIKNSDGTTDLGKISTLFDPAFKYEESYFFNRRIKF